MTEKETAGLSNRLNMQQRTMYALGEAVQNFMAAQLRGTPDLETVKRLHWLVAGLDEHMPDHDPVFHHASGITGGADLALTELLQDRQPRRPGHLRLVTPDFEPDTIPF